MNRDTRIQHLAESRSEGGSVPPPVHRTSLFTFPDCAAFEDGIHGRRGHVYTRISNPTTRIYERKLADLENAEDALALGSGMAAVAATLLGLLQAGDHVVMLSGAYGPTLSFARQILKRFGVETSFVAPHAFATLERHLKPTTRLVYLESPASLTFEILDLRAIADQARSRRILTVIDNSWATPLFQRPLDFGIDLVLHSGTKYLGGHSDILLGVIAGAGEPFARVRETAIALGATLSPEDAFLATRGLRTLSLRMARHQTSGLELARFLEAHPQVRKVLHPGLESFPGHALARSQLDGWSGLFSFVLDGDPRRLADSLELFSIGVSWGGFESLVLPIDLLFTKPAERELRADIEPGLVRLSVGLEDAEDLRDDLEQALAKC